LAFVNENKKQMMAHALLQLEQRMQEQYVAAVQNLNKQAQQFSGIMEALRVQYRQMEPKG
jgi:hypothetical protein